jgi:hypothetical protein
VDVWSGGINLLRDAGTYSYNTASPWQEYFPGVEAHNTIQFDGGNQMPRLSPFLYGAWPRATRKFQGDGTTAWVEAGYRDWRGNRHSRRLETVEDGFRVTDRIRGFKQDAVVRWRLAPEVEWTLDADGCHCLDCRLHVRAEGGAPRIAMTQAWESLYYMERTELPVLEVRVSPAVSTVVTEILFDRLR